MKHIICSILFLLIVYASSYATHNRAGEITYRHISGNTYEVTIVTYTYTPSAANEYRGQLLIDWGDGTKSYVQRSSEEFLPDNYTKNTYVGIHTYPGPGVYEIIMEDPNRNLGIKNIFDSVNIPFTISTILKVDPVLGGNSTPILLNPPVDKAALGQRFVHNPAAFDIDGDSLSYSLAVCRGKNGEKIPGYTFPAASREFRVDSINGDLIWDAPMAVGSYNVAMHIEEWRNGVKIGFVARDIQIEVYETDNNVPEFAPIEDICVRAGDTVRLTISAIDPDGDPMHLSARGGPLEETVTKADFPSTTGVGTVSSEFLWVPSVEEVRKQPYTVVFKATDMGRDISLSALQYLNIQVIGHPATSVEAIGTALENQLSWEHTHNNFINEYKVYRSSSPTNYITDYCEYDLPTELQNTYSHIATTQGNITDFTDNNNDWGLIPGTYCYRIVPMYNDGFPGPVSDEICVNVEQAITTITHASVTATDCAKGEIFISWTQIDTSKITLFDPPFAYHILRAEGFTPTSFTEIAQIHSLTDTMYTDINICTEFSPYTYRVAVYSHANNSTTLLGKSAPAASPFISIFSR